MKVDPTLFGKPYFGQVILRFGRKLQRRHVTKQQDPPAAIRSVGKAFLGDRITLTVGVDLADVPVDGLMRHQLRTQIRQDPQGLKLVGSTIRAITRSRNTGSATTSKPGHS